MSDAPHYPDLVSGIIRDQARRANAALQDALDKAQAAGVGLRIHESPLSMGTGESLSADTYTVRAVTHLRYEPLPDQPGVYERHVHTRASWAELLRRLG
jgi:hypothetical protein